jgi:TolB protein
VAAGDVAVASTATAPGPNRRLAFRRYLDRDHSWGGLFTAWSDGSGIRPLTHTERRVVDSEPDWSPDGRQIVFQRIRLDGCGPGCETDEIVRVNADGSGLTRLAYDGTGEGCVQRDAPAGGVCRQVPAWSPDGRRIAFECSTSAPGGNPYLGRICVMNADGSNVRQLPRTPEAGVGDSAPAWSPDGRRIAFQRALLDGKGNVGRDAVFTMNADGSQPTRLTPWALRGGQPDWSPNGKQIVFYSNWGGPEDVSANLYVIRPDGTGLRRLTEARGGSAQHLSATFSPDGKWIAFGKTPGMGREGNADVFVMHADGTRVRNVTRSAIWDSGVDWGPRS